MKITDILNEINFYQRYREICLAFANIDYTKQRPSKEFVLLFLNNIGYPAKYNSKDRLFIYKVPEGIYSFEYYFEIDGCGCDVSVCIKQTSTDWPLIAGFTGLLLSSKLYPSTENDQVAGYMLFTPSQKELENALLKLKPILDDLKKEIIPYLINDTLEFDIS